MGKMRKASCQCYGTQEGVFSSLLCKSVCTTALQQGRDCRGPDSKDGFFGNKNLSLILLQDSCLVL